MTSAWSLLCRHHPERGALALIAFVPLGGEAGSILPLGQWLFGGSHIDLKSGSIDLACAGSVR